MRIKILPFALLVLLLFSFTGLRAEDWKSQYNNRSLLALIKDISEQFDVYFTYDREIIENIEVENKYEPEQYKNAEEALSSILVGTNLKYVTLENKYVIIYQNDGNGLKSLERMKEAITKVLSGEKRDTDSIQHLGALERVNPVDPQIQEEIPEVSGKVTSQSGEVLIGVSVLVKGTSKGTATNVNGDYHLSDVNETDVLVFTYLGYQKYEVPVGSQSVINVTLIQDQQSLDEVVVIGYGSVAKKDITTAVSTISVGDIDERPIISTAQAIQGKAAGVNVYQPNGTPGGEMVIRIRGTTSFNGSNSPLYVVDGVPVDNLNFLSPTDIASIQILKDASSAAIYGSRAANGVVLITTKMAGNNAKISANIQYGLSQVANPIKSLNAVQYKSLMDEIRPGAIPEGTVDKTDWFKEVYGTGITENYQLQVSDRNEKTSYYLSGGYLNEKGVLNAAFFRRYNFRSNVESQVRNWLKLRLNTSYSDNTNNGITTGQGSNRGGVVLAVVNLPTAVPVIDENTGLYNRVFFGQNITNPIEALENGKNNMTNENRLIASGNATVTFLPEMDFKSSLTVDRRNGKVTGFTPPVHGADRDDWGDGWDTRSMNTLLIFDNVLNYKKSFQEKHNFEGMLGTSWTNSKWSQGYINGSHYKDASIHTLNAANKIAWDNTGSNASEWGIMSMFGRLMYNFESKYLLTVNLRRDGSSKLHPDLRWGTFPSASAAWRISSEKFMKDITWINDLKIRGGWGQTGNQSGVGDYAYLQRYNTVRQPWFEAGKEDALPTLQQANLRTSDLTWETTNQVNIGLDLSLFKDNLNISMDYYYKQTKNMLMFVSLPAGSAAADNIVRNEGEMLNRGFEFSASSKNFKGPFVWNTDFNISFNRNRLKNLELQQIYYDAETTDAFHQTRVVRNEPGRALGGFYGYISDGVDPETGELMYRDLNKDGRITASDKTYIGDPNPFFIFGLTNNFSYKGFSLDVFIQGSVGNEIFNTSKGDTEGMYDLKNQSVEVLKRWRTPGQITDIPKAGFNLQPSSFFVEDGSYLRVKSVSLSYNFNVKALEKIGISRLQPYITANNLFTITKYSGMDPEVNQWGDSGAVQGIDWGTYPQSRMFLLGLNLEF